eukprot:6474293-Amphidinium_carterae.1
MVPECVCCGKRECAMVGEIVGRISEQYSQDSGKRQSLLEDTSRTSHPGYNCSKTSNREDKERPDHSVCNRGEKWGQARGTSEQDSAPSNEERSTCGERERVPLDMPTSCYLATLSLEPKMSGTFPNDLHGQDPTEGPLSTTLKSLETQTSNARFASNSPPNDCPTTTYAPACPIPVPLGEP